MQRRNLLKLALASPALMALSGCQEEPDAALKTLMPGDEPDWGLMKEELEEAEGIADEILNNVNNDEALNILVMGDSGSGNENQEAATQAIREFHDAYPLDLVLHTGDVIYSHPHADPYHDSYFEKFTKHYQFLENDEVPFYAWPGNHDHKSSSIDGLLAFAQMDNPLRMPATFYGINTHELGLGEEKPEVEVVGIDTYKMVKNGTYLDQLAYLDRRLAESKAAVKLVIGHHPLRSNGKHGDSQPIEDYIQALMEKHGVLAYLAGHEHDLELMYPKGGVNYMISGGGGASLRQMSVRANTRFAASHFGAFVLRVTHNSVHAIPLLAEPHTPERYAAYLLS